VTQILYDARWVGNHGIGRFAAEIQKRLPALTAFDVSRRPWHPLDPWLLGSSLRRLRPRMFFSPGYNSPLGWPGDFVFTLHDLNHLRVPDNSTALKRAYYRYVIRPACHRAAFVLTVSDYSKGEIAAWAGLTEDRIVNVGNGVGSPFVCSGDAYRPGYPYLLYVGSRKSHKNLSRLLQAYAASGVQRDVHLLLSGSPDAQTQADSARLAISGQVKFIEVSDNRLLASVYRGATGFLFPSLYEGFGLPPLEAMACGVPVLTSNVCSLPEVVGNAAILVDPLSRDDIALGIRRLAQDTELRAQLRHRGLARAAAFRWEDTARKVSEVLAHITGDLAFDEQGGEPSVSELMRSSLLRSNYD
jgi:glycosyltransferase involved in cell wall biosynthesis